MMGSVVAADSIATEREVAPTLPEPIDGPVDIEGAPKGRTKLHLYTILVALYAGYTFSVAECR